MSNVNVAYVFQGPITEPEKETITQTVQLNLDNKMSGYIEKLKKNNDDSITLKVVIEKNHDPENEVGHGFNGTFTLSAPGVEPLRYAREDFHQLTDLVNHAFDRFKETLASK